MEDIRKIARIQLLIVLIFALFKFIRPRVVHKDVPDFLKTFLWSFPNLCEAVIGVITLTAIGLVLNKRLKTAKKLGPGSVYILATVLAGIYVISQELKFHNLGGNNVYDPMDLIFSVIGLLLGYALIKFLSPIVKPE